MTFKPSCLIYVRLDNCVFVLNKYVSEWTIHKNNLCVLKNRLTFKTNVPCYYLKYVSIMQMWVGIHMHPFRS